MRLPRNLLTSAALAAPLVLLASATGPALPAVAATSSPAKPTKVLVIVEENHTEVSALKGMPHLRKLADRYGHTTNYRAVTHPSLPNYLAIVGGSTFGVKNDDPPSAHHVHGSSVFDEALAAHQSAALYAESMPSDCALKPKGHYAVKHNPWAYFSDTTSRTNCRKYDVPAGTTAHGALHTAIRTGTLPTVGMLIPNICNDAHNCSLTTADRWLERWMVAIRQGADWKAGRLAVVVTFDEDDHHGNNTVLTTVMAPQISHVIANASYTHYSLARYAAYLAGVVAPRHARSARSLRPAFGL